MKWRARSEVAQARPILYREEPSQRYTSVETEVLVPTFQALVVSVAWAVLAGMVVGLLAQPLGLRWWMIPVVALAVVVVLFALQVTRLINERRDLLWKREEIENRDLDGDGLVGKPPPRRDLGLVYVRDPYRQKRIVRATDFRHFLREAYGGHGTTWRVWDGAALPSGRKMTRPAWEDWTGRLIQAGLATREYDTAPLDLTGSYREALATFREAL